ncbi:MAG: hypothetical protein ONB46_10995 [candidate division KSB1 bacterium]|nr:hypothetical protein [candidate division KSB1 bacterium]MDZ7366385.1 hypothetical protein [candidate division KSB1 bacterium]MDZ7404040.1 hypothetical protein [candidate division KSB1 bacterium]
MRAINKIAWLFMLIGLPLLAQTPGRIKLQSELDDLSTTLERLQRRQQLLSLQADSLAKDIQRRKQQAPSLLQERGLDAALRFSQTLADSLQMLQGREQRLDFSLRQKAEVLLKILNEDIARLVKQGEALKRGKDLASHAQIMRELQQCRDWQRRCQAWLEQPPPSIIIYQVEAQPGDTPETLRRKSDFLRDQSDRLRREVKRLDAKITDIRGETQVRRRVADFAADLSLLDPNREGVASPSSGDASTSLLGVERGSKDAVQLSNPASAQLPVYQNWPAQLGELSFDELEWWRRQLERQKKQRQAQADSLMKRAAEIDKQIGQPARENR